jgi:hypothetical protein
MDHVSENMSSWNYGAQEKENRQGKIEAIFQSWLSISTFGRKAKTLFISVLTQKLNALPAINRKTVNVPCCFSMREEMLGWP